MPIDHYKMSIEAKPLYSVLGKSDAGSLMKIIRPLGSIRRAKLSNCSTTRSENLRKSLDVSAEGELVQSDSFSDTADDPDSRFEISADQQEESNSFREDQFLPKMQRTKNKVFESRYKIAASRNNESVKPAKLYNKRVVYLPMFRINVETYVGNEQDTLAVENTRQSLKMMIDKGRRQSRPTARIQSASVKSYNFLTPGKEGDAPILDIASPRPLIQTKRSSVSNSRRNCNVTAMSECHCSVDGRRRLSEGTSDDTDRMEVNFECLDLNSSGEESVTDQDLVSIDNRTEISRAAPSETATMMSVRRKKSRAYVSLTDPYRHVRQSAKEQDQSKTGWPSYEDFRKMKQKPRNHNQSKKQPLEPKKPGNDVQKWVNIHYTKSKPPERYTPTPTFPKLDPIIVPSHTWVDCPMCEMAANTERGPTPCPPNSPVSYFTKSSPSPHHCHSDTKSQFRDSNATVRNTQTRNELSIPKVTVKILDTKQQLEEAKLSYSKFPN